MLLRDRVDDMTQHSDVLFSRGRDVFFDDRSLCSRSLRHVMLSSRRDIEAAGSDSRRFVISAFQDLLRSVAPSVPLVRELCYEVGRHVVFRKSGCLNLTIRAWLAQGMHIQDLPKERADFALAFDALTIVGELHEDLHADIEGERVGRNMMAMAAADALNAVVFCVIYELPAALAEVAMNRAADVMSACTARSLGCGTSVQSRGNGSDPRLFRRLGTLALDVDLCDSNLVTPESSPKIQ